MIFIMLFINRYSTLTFVAINTIPATFQCIRKNLAYTIIDAYILTILFVIIATKNEIIFGIIFVAVTCGNVVAISSLSSSFSSRQQISLNKSFILISAISFIFTFAIVFIVYSFNLSLLAGTC